MRIHHIGLLGLLILLSTSTFSSAADPKYEPAEQPLMILVIAGVGAPTGVMGGSVSYEFSTPLALEIGGGLGLTGWQGSVMGRYYTPWLDWSHHRINFGLGASVGLAGRSVSLDIAHNEATTTNFDNRLFHVGYLNGEIAYELRAAWGGALRFTLGFAARLSENMSGLCDGIPKGIDEPNHKCNPRHFAPSSKIAALPTLVYMSMGYGWAF